MNGKVSDKNLFIDGVSHKRNIPCGFEFRTLFTKRVSLSILLKYDAPVLNLFWTHSKAVATDVVW